MEIYRPCGRAVTLSSLERKVWGLILGAFKSDTALPTACHRWDISLKVVVFPKQMTRKWTVETCDMLQCNTASIMKDFAESTLRETMIYIFLLNKFTRCTHLLFEGAKEKSCSSTKSQVSDALRRVLAATNGFESWISLGPPNRKIPKTIKR